MPCFYKQCRPRSVASSSVYSDQLASEQCFWSRAGVISSMHQYIVIFLLAKLYRNTDSMYRYLTILLRYINKRPKHKRHIFFWAAYADKNCLSKRRRLYPIKTVGVSAVTTGTNRQCHCRLVKWLKYGPMCYITFFPLKCWYFQLHVCHSDLCEVILPFYCWYKRPLLT